MKRWFVVTPMFPYTEVVLDDGTGPTYDIADVIEVEAETRRDAIKLGVVAMLKDERNYTYCRDQRSDDASPYTGVRAEPYDLNEALACR